MLECEKFEQRDSHNLEPGNEKCTTTTAAAAAAAATGRQDKKTPGDL